VSHPDPMGHVPQPVPPEVVNGTAQPSGAAQFLSTNGIYVPLVGVSPNDVLSGGYGWLSPTDYDAYGVPHSLHPGLDLNAGSGGNADCGLPVCAPVDCVVEAVLPWNGAGGEGNHLWLRTEDTRAIAPAWVHYDHLQAIHVGVGQVVVAGQTVGLCGATGGWDWCHLHLELAKQRPASWWVWPYGWSRGQVEAAYFDPSAWYWETVSKAGQGVVPEEAMKVLNDWELAHWIMPELWGWAGIPYNPEALTSKAWLEELRQGRYRGRPRTADRPYGDGRGHWAEFEQGCVVTRTDSGEWSWQG
jgi:murein DD-endopeptidase MepM/ murein hydrolase activator NlpD